MPLTRPRRQRRGTALRGVGVAAWRVARSISGVMRNALRGTSAVKWVIYTADWPVRWCFLTVNSLNCAKKKLPCHYMPKIPLRERRTKARPGQQMVWSVTQSQAAAVITSPDETSLMTLLSDVMRPSGVFDPFDALPIKMPLRSKELLHYCLFAYPSSATTYD